MNTKKVSDYMTSNVATVSPDIGVIVALRTLLEHNQSAAPVVDDQGIVVGVLSEADCMQGTLMGSYFEQSGAIVKDQMTTELHTVSPTADLVSAAEIFLAHKRRMLPVVESGKLVGMLTRHHILRALLHEIDTPSHH